MKPLVCIFFILTFLSCRIMPIQMTRVSQSETFRQSFDFGDPNSGTIREDTQQLLTDLIGEKNLEILLNLLGTVIIDDVINHHIEARGLINVQLSIVPSDHSQFYVDGVGRYLLVNTSGQEPEVLYTADFALIPNRQKISDLESGEIELEFKQYLINHFGRPDEHKNYLPQNHVKVKLQIAKPYSKKPIFHVDYTKPHGVWIKDKNIGSLKFDEPVNLKDKLIDLRGLKYVRNDY